MRRIAFENQAEAPDNTVFWSIVGVISVFIVVLASVMVLRSGATGQIVFQFPNPTVPYEPDVYACLGMPPCSSDTSYLCCAPETLPGSNLKCVPPLTQSLPTLNYGSPGYGGTGRSMPGCPALLPYACACPEKFQSRQSWPIPVR
jgi:hypothetical protein